jgi:FMN reductase
MTAAQTDQPLIVGIGGTTKAGSSTESALIVALDAAAAEGARTRLFDGPYLARLPHYGTEEAMASEEGRALVAALRAADGVILASPGYHGSISGLVKNAIDYAEETARDARVYFDGVPIGLIATAYGWQATGSTLATLRSIVHALRGWPTPLGAAINSSGGIFKQGKCTDPGSEKQLLLVGRQVVEFARLHRLKPSITETGPELS